MHQTRLHPAGLQCHRDQVLKSQSAHGYGLISEVNTDESEQKPEVTHRLYMMDVQQPVMQANGKIMKTHQMI